MKFVTLSLLATALTVGGNAAEQARSSKQPNILFILADAFGWRDLACTGSRYYESPNIDGIARNGVRFTQGYAACQVSSPSRASIMTGKFTARHGITNWIGEGSGEEWRKMGRHSKLLPAQYVWQLPKEDITLPEALKAHGYKTFMAGKWHLGGEGSYPEDHGFDINIGGHEAGGPYPGGYFAPYGNPKMKEGPDGENLSMRLAHETASFIETHTRRNKKQPFFAFLSFYAVHAPIETTEAKWRHFRNKADSMGIAPVGFEVDRTLPVRLQQDNPIYAGLIQQMDDAVGVVLAKLHELGLDENTIIVFTSDNGGVSSGDAYATSNYPLRGGKGRQWEGGIRVPLFIDFPGNTLKGDSCVVPVTGADLYPTFLDMAGIPLMPGQHQDGVSLLPLLQGKSIPERALYWHYPHYGNQGGEPSSIIRQGDWKLIHYYEDGRDELYNLRIDETESEPLNVQYPEKVEFLSKKLSVWLTEVGARYPEPDPQYNPAAEALYKKKTRERMMKTLEATRKKQLGKDFKPNADWWGSETKD